MPPQRALGHIHMAGLAGVMEMSSSLKRLARRERATYGVSYRATKAYGVVYCVDGGERV